jgi:hypothetical protein
MTDPRSAFGAAASSGRRWRSRKAGSAAAAWVGVWLAACSSSPPPSGFFPLEAGHRWTYDVKTEWDNNIVEHEDLVLSTHGNDGRIDGGGAYRRRSEDGVDYWLRSDDTGIYRVASKSDLDAEPKLDAQRRYVLKAPFAAGSSWQASTTAYLLRRRNEFPREIRHTHPQIDMTYTIEALGQSVQTRAGKHDNCLRVKGQAAVRVYADPVVGWRDMPLTTTEWYCDGVGLVRLTREEPAPATFLTGGTLTMELVAWQ